MADPTSTKSPPLRLRWVILIGGLLGCGLAHPQMTLEEVQLIDEGFRVFDEETFDGNGRTCTTCHIPETQYNIFPSHIATLDGEELDLVLASNVPGLENPTLIMERGLFNVGEEGEGDTALDCDDEMECHGPIFRGSMGIAALALNTVFINDTFNPENTCAPGLRCSMLGWSGQGSPRNFHHHGVDDPDADGSVRAFANGAVAQHFTTCLERTLDECFRFATAEEMDAMEAFQNWLGRREQFFIRDMVFSDARAERGRELYMSNEASCNTCHFNGGANFSPSHFIPDPVGANIFQHSDVDLDRFRLTELTGVFIPEDEGFIFEGQNPAAMNGQSAVESVPKEAFFHKHIILNGSGEEIEEGGGIEGAISFYFREPFVSSEIHTALQGLLTGPAMGGDGTGNGHIGTLEEFLDFGGEGAIEEMGAFLRSLSAFYKIRDCERLVGEMIDRINLGADRELPEMHCRFNLDDAAKVLSQAQVRPTLYVSVLQRIGTAKSRLRVAGRRQNTQALGDVIEDLAELRSDIATTPELP